MNEKVLVFYGQSFGTPPSRVAIPSLEGRQQRRINDSSKGVGRVRDSSGYPAEAPVCRLCGGVASAGWRTDGAMRWLRVQPRRHAQLRQDDKAFSPFRFDLQHFRPQVRFVGIYRTLVRIRVGAGYQ